MTVTQLIARLALTAPVPLLALIIVAAGIGHLMPANDRWRVAQKLDYCDLPCWAGITPRQTDYHQLAELLGQAFPEADVTIIDRSDETATLASFYAYGDRSMSGTIIADQGRVARMGLDLYVPLWFLLRHLGQPDFVTNGASPMTRSRLIDGPSMIIHWRRADLRIAAVLLVSPGMRLHPETRTYFIQIEAADDVSPTILPWRGFVPVDFYGVRSLHNRP